MKKESESVFLQAKQNIFESVIDNLIKNEKMERNESIINFINSQTFEMLENKETEFYGESPTWIYNCYKAERENKLSEYLNEY